MSDMVWIIQPVRLPDGHFITVEEDEPYHSIGFVYVRNKLGEMVRGWGYRPDGTAGPYMEYVLLFIQEQEDAHAKQSKQ